MTIYALCPNCGKSLEDSGDTRFIECSTCGRIIQSRVYGKNMDEEHGISSTPRKIGRVDRLAWLGPVRGVGGFLCWLAIVIFIVILIINFVTFFPALAITAPELLNEHHNEIRTELPLVIDDTPPIISELQNLSGTYFAGQVLNLAVSIAEPHLKEGYFEVDLNGSMAQVIPRKHYLRFNPDVNKYETSFQVPTEIGTHQLIIVAEDYAGNIAIKRLNYDVIPASSPFLILNPYLDYSIMNSSEILEFSPTNGNISKVTYRLGNQIDDISLFPPYSISTSNWPEGQNQLNLTIYSNNVIVGYQNYSIFIDDSKPLLKSLSIQPLTISRNDTFRNRLNASKGEYYRGELVKLKININENNLATAQVVLDDNTYDLESSRATLPSRETSGTYYETIFSMPSEPGEYELKIVTSDLTGNSQVLTHEFKIARVNYNYIPVPILNLSAIDNDHALSLPIINSTVKITIPVDFGELVKLNISNASGKSSKSVDYTDYVNLSSLPEGEQVLGLHAKISFHYWDYLFISVPFPPFLVVLPFVLTGWSLFGFYLFIALAIILSNLYLFKSSITEALKQLNAAAKKLRAPMMESKNALIMLAQLFLAVYSFNWIYFQVLDLASVPTRTPDFSSLSNWALIYNLTSATVYEEIISRTLLIGIPLFFIHALIRRIKKSKWNYLLGGGFEVNKITIILILFSSITFGLAHAPGWDYWKVIPTFISGFALGYLFIRKGIFAAILLHFSINFLTIPLRLVNYSPFVVWIYFFIILFFIAIGVIYFGYYLTRVIGLFRKSKSYT